jgi:hypothetical protein
MEAYTLLEKTSGAGIQYSKRWSTCSGRLRVWYRIMLESSAAKRGLKPATTDQLTRNRIGRQKWEIYRREINVAERTAKSIGHEQISSRELQDLSAGNQCCRWNRKTCRSETNLVDRTARSIGQQPILSIAPRDHIAQQPISPIEL